VVSATATIPTGHRFQRSCSFCSLLCQHWHRDLTLHSRVGGAERRRQNGSAVRGSGRHPSVSVNISALQKRRCGCVWGVLPPRWLRDKPTCHSRRFRNGTTAGRERAAREIETAVRCGKGNRIETSDTVNWLREGSIATTAGLHTKLRWFSMADSARILFREILLT